MATDKSVVGMLQDLCRNLGDCDVRISKYSQHKNVIYSTDPDHYWEIHAPSTPSARNWYKNLWAQMRHKKAKAYGYSLASLPSVQSKTECASRKKSLPGLPVDLPRSLIADLLQLMDPMEGDVDDILATVDHRIIIAMLSVMVETVYFIHDFYVMSCVDDDSVASETVLEAPDSNDCHTFQVCIPDDLVVDILNLTPFSNEKGKWSSEKVALCIMQIMEIINTFNDLYYNTTGENLAVFTL